MVMKGAVRGSSMVWVGEEQLGGRMGGVLGRKGGREEGSCSGELRRRTGGVWVIKGAIWVNSEV